MDAQKLYNEWKELCQLSKLVTARKKDIKNELDNCKGEYVPLRTPESLQREFEMVERYRSGETLQEIGDSYGITRERVRQLIKKTGTSGHSLGRYQYHSDGAIAK